MKRWLMSPFTFSLAQGALRLILANLFWHFDFELSDETKRDWPNQDAFLRWQKTPLVIQLKPRQEQAMNGGARGGHEKTRDA